jgi:hypothetical protein
MTRQLGPQLSINYSPEFELCLTCVRAQEYQAAGFVEYRFETKCRFRHPTGYFEYFAGDLCFDPGGFAHFSEELHNMRQGTTDHAALKNVGDMLVLQLDRTGRKLRLKISVREYLPPDELGSLSVAVDVDYDLFVNKLPQEVEEFLVDLRSMEAEKLS